MTPTALFVEFARLAARSRPFNLVVTNVPGPAFPWGFNADWDAIPDLHDLVDAVRLEFERHADAARVTGTAQAVPAG